MSTKLKTAKGTRDFSPKMMAILQFVFGVIRETFQKYGAEEIDTPVFEMREILTNKYGEDSKLIYDLADQGGDILSLRYDLTVPFSRYLAMNKLQNFKRFHIAKVYRRDNPSMSRGRFREFYQCDFDIAGVNFDPMLPDIECIAVAVEILQKLDIPKFSVKINHRSVISAILLHCGVEAGQVQTVSSSIDKCDKLPWDRVAEELINEKKLKKQVVDNLQKFVVNSFDFLNEKDPKKVFEDFEGVLKDIDNNNEQLRSGVADLRLLAHYAGVMGILPFIRIDLSMVRGLDYYTGLIYEFVFDETDKNNENSSVGSIAAGGRYDNLVGSLMNSKKNLPCVGISIGIERILHILTNKIDGAFHGKKTQVLVASAQKNLMDEKLKILTKLRQNDIKTEIVHKTNPKLLNQLQYCEDNHIPVCVIVGEDEIRNGAVSVKNIKTRQQQTVKLEELANFIKELLR